MREYADLIKVLSEKHSLALHLGMVQIGISGQPTDQNLEQLKLKLSKFPFPAGYSRVSILIALRKKNKIPLGLGIITECQSKTNKFSNTFLRK